MKHTVLRLMGLMMALALVLSGCNLVGIDPIMQLDEDMAAKVKQFSNVVARYDGGEITQEKIMGSLNSQYSYMSQMYSMYGMNMTSDMLTNLKEAVVKTAVEDVAIAKQMESRGLTLSEDKLAEIQTQADDTYKQAYDSFYGQTSGKDEAVRAKQTEYDMYSAGYTKDTFYNSQLADANRELLEETVKGEIAEVTDEELQAAYDEHVSDDEETYQDNASAFESAMSSDDAVCWMPEGYRTVKHILVKPEDDVLTAVTDARTAFNNAEDALEDLREEMDSLNDDDAGEDADAEAEADAEPTEAPRTAEAIQADIEAAQTDMEEKKAAVEAAEAACLASVQDKLDEIYGKIEAGEDFATLIETYGEDPGMKNEPTASRGYYVSADSTTWDANFTQGAMALEKVGDVSEKPVISTSGVHIIRYESDVTPGAVPLEDVKDALYEETLEDMKEEHYDTELDSWIEALKPEYLPEAIDLGE